MEKKNRPIVKGCGIIVAVVLVIPILIVAVTGIRTWVPLQDAGQALDELDRSLGDRASYRPAPSGAIPADRMEIFLELRSSLATACLDYGEVRQGFDMVDSLETHDPKDTGEVLDATGEAVVELGGAALAITPFLGRYFEARNEALLSVGMGLEEYAYIYAVAYHDQLLSPGTLREIFSDGVPLSPEASVMLQECLGRQGGGREDIESELAKMKADPKRLIWQDGLPAAVQGSIAPNRYALDRVFCAATAGLEMERSPRRALGIALE